MREGDPGGGALNRLACCLDASAFGAPLSGRAHKKRRDQEVAPVCLMAWRLDGRCGTMWAWRLDGRCGTMWGSFDGKAVRRGTRDKVIGHERHPRRSAKGIGLASGRGERH